ncbi:MAG TPA: hypothetical protein VJN94_15055 [Candidatus Binataceae bacterium]|nr:hypothetical protein [Candidatus Binataceae bacterium]
MRLLSDILVFFGAIILTFGSDLVIETAGQNMSSVGGLLGVVASLIGVAFLTTGLLNHHRLTREQASEIEPEPPVPPKRAKTGAPN